jgi:hypothetical protein
VDTEPVLTLLASPLLGPAVWSRVAASLADRGREVLVPPAVGEVAPLFPDAATRAAVEAEQPRLPLSYFDAAVPSPSGWQDLPAAYLAFGDTYAAERDVARARGWPVTTLPGEHLHLLCAPDAVTDALLGLVGRLGLSGEGPAPIRV